MRETFNKLTQAYGNQILPCDQIFLCHTAYFVRRETGIWLICQFMKWRQCEKEKNWSLSSDLIDICWWGGLVDYLNSSPLPFCRSFLASKNLCKRRFKESSFLWPNFCTVSLLSLSEYLELFFLFNNQNRTLWFSFGNFSENRL